MKKIFLIITIILFSIANIYSQHSNNDSLTIDKAVSLTLQNFPLIKQAKENVDVYNAKIDVQGSSYYPDVSAVATYNRIGPVPSFDLPQGAFQLYPENNYDAHVEVKHNLYDFGRRNAERQLLESFKTSAIDNVQMVKTNFAFATIRTYYSILFLHKSVAVIDTDIATLNQHIDITKKKIESGTATEYDLLSTKVRLTDYKGRKIDLQNELKKQKINLEHLTGLTSLKQSAIKGNFLETIFDINSDSLTEVAFAQRPELKLAIDAEQSAHLKENLASLGSRPNVGLYLSYGVKNGYVPNIDAWHGNWVAGFQVNVPIFDGFRTKNQEEESRANTIFTETGTVNLKQQIRAEVEKAVEDLNSNLEQIKTAKEQIEFAKESLQKAKAQYASGVGTNLDLLDAETRLADARFLYLKEIYQNIINGYELKKAVGDVVW
jgi:outer membrane protein TolC